MNIIENFLTTQQNIRMYHWTTKIYNQHVISGNLYEKLDELFDKFVETYLGKYETLNYKKLTIISNQLNSQELLKFLTILFKFTEANKKIDKKTVNLIIFLFRLCSL